MQTMSATQLLTARVISCEDGRLNVMLEGGQTAQAVPAFSAPYQAAPGDLLLLLCDEETRYAVGVLAGTGRTVFKSAGDIELCSMQGNIRLTAAHEVNVTGREVTLRANRLEVIAKAAKERFGEAMRWVKGVLRVKAGRARTTVEGQYELHAERINEKAKQEVNIDGKQINLG